VLGLALLSLLASAPSAGPDLLLENATVYASADAQAKKVSIVTRGGRIAYVGPAPQARRQAVNARRVDLSGSFGPSGKRESIAFRRKLSDALTQFLTAGNPENEYFVGTFNTRIAFSETWTGPGPQQSILEKFDAPEHYGTTAMYDALYHAIEQVMKGRHSRRVILLITDGLDNESRRSFKDVAKLVKRSDVSIYAVGIYDTGYGSGYGVRQGMGVLDELTKLSGGRTVYLKTGADPELVQNAFQILADNLQSQYQLTIETEAGTGREKWRKLKLKLNLPEDKNRPKLDVWSPLGFYQ